MEPSTFRSVFLRQLRYWSLHCSLNALPSFGIALRWLHLWGNSSAMVAMISAVCSFILLFTTFTSVCGPLSDEGHLFSRALKQGAKIRAWVSGISLLLTFTPMVVLSPDLWSGCFAIGLLNKSGQLITGVENSFFIFDDGEGSKFASGFWPIYAITMLEGFILSFLLLMISFFALFFIHRKAQRRTALGYPAFEE